MFQIVSWLINLVMAFQRRPALWEPNIPPEVARPDLCSACEAAATLYRWVSAPIRAVEVCLPQVWIYQIRTNHRRRIFVLFVSQCNSLLKFWDLLLPRLYMYWDTYRKTSIRPKITKIGSENLPRWSLLGLLWRWSPRLLGLGKAVSRNQV